MAEAVRNRFRAWINEILRQRASANLDSDSQESVFFRVETLYNTIVRFDTIVRFLVNHQKMINNIIVNSMNSIEPHNCIIQSFDTKKKLIPGYLNPNLVRQAVAKSR